MKVLRDENLSNHTTIQIGGIAKKFVIPENVKELVYLYNEKHPKYFIGGGSNLLISEREYDMVVDLSKFSTLFEHKGEGIFQVGASIRLQSFINGINNEGYGGIEYLFSVPGLVGGAVVMNAGRGEAFHQCISDYIVSVEYIYNDAIKTILRDECEFAYRTSLFKKINCVVISCTFQFPKIEKLEADRKKKERIEICKRVQDNSAPNFGSVFAKCNPKIMKIVKTLRIGGGKSIRFSSKTDNWLLNRNAGSFEEAIRAINKVETIHRFARKNCEREVIVWE